MRHAAVSLACMAEQIRTFGDPVLKSKAAPVADVDGKALRLVDKMFGALYTTDNGLALAAPQIGVQKQVVVWDFGEDPKTIFNPEIVESDGEWVYEEGCLSIPGLYVEIVRPKTVLVRGVDLDGNVGEWEADEIEARMFQHELDHLNGVLMFDRMTPDQRKEALAEYERMQQAAAEPRRAAACACADRPTVRLAFLGTPEMAVPPLRALVAAGHEIVLVVTRADRRRGRGSALVAEPGEGGGASSSACPSPTTSSDLLAIDADLGVVVAYGRIIKPHVLAHLPMVNVHFSLLPRWRGAAPVERALLAGDDVTGVCIMDVEEGLDTGGVYARREVPIGPATTADELRARARRRSAPSCSSTCCRGRSAGPTPQDGDVTYAEKIAPDELQLDWTRPAVELDRWVRVGGAWTTFRGRRLKVLAADTDRAGGRRWDAWATTPPRSAPAPAALRLDTVQPEGKAAMPWSAFANGARPRAGRTTRRSRRS